MTLVGALVLAAYSVELWVLYWWYPIGIGARLVLVAVVAVLLMPVHMLTQP